MAKRKPATKEDISFIKAYSSGENAFTDEEIAKLLGGSTAWVRKLRKEHNISKSGVSRKKTTGEKLLSHKINNGEKTVVNEIPTSSENSIRKIFEDIFKNTSQYSLLEKMYSKEELDYYLEEFTTLVSEIKSQGGTLTSSEFRNLDQWIQLMIRKNRLSIQEKECKDSIERTLAPFNGNIDEADDEAKALIYQLNVATKDIPKTIKDITDQSIKIQTELEMTRRERLKRIADSEKGVLHLIQTMQDDIKRAKIDRQAAMLLEAQKKIKNEWKTQGLIITAEEEEATFDKDKKTK